MIVDASISITAIRLTATRDPGGIRIIDRVSSKEPPRSNSVTLRLKVDLLNIGKAGRVDSWEGVEGMKEGVGGGGVPSSGSSNSTCELVFGKTTGALAISSKFGDGHDGGWGW